MDVRFDHGRNRLPAVVRDLTMKDMAMQWMAHHGYWGIFSLLVLGIVGLPIPDEWLLTLAGYFVFKQTFRFVPTLASAFLGSACGITLSYVLGRTFGTFLLVHYGSKFRITHDDVDRVHAWFRKIGRWTLTFGYFIPGVRHLTAYVAGASELEVPVFVAFAYLGGLLWSLTFIAVGYYLGEESRRISEIIHHVGQVSAVVGVVVIGAYIIVRRQRRA
jgi:membrane protein DedA with SNARE-associated domain